MPSKASFKLKPKKKRLFSEKQKLRESSPEELNHKNMVKEVVQAKGR